jgi:transcriptional regulator with XRE-family HTH domain
MEFPNTLKRVLKEEQKSQAQLAESAGVTQAYISRACNDRLPCSAGDLWRLLRPLKKPNQLDALKAYVADVVPAELLGHVQVKAKENVTTTNLSHVGELALSFILEQAKSIPEIEESIMDIAASLGWKYVPPKGIPRGAAVAKKR